MRIKNIYKNTEKRQKVSTSIGHCSPTKHEFKSYRRKHLFHKQICAKANTRMRYKRIKIDFGI